MKNHLLIIAFLSLGSCQTKTDKIQPTEQNLTQSVYTSVIIQPDGLYQVKG